MERNFIFFDYDGTLRSRAQNGIPQSARRALDLLRENGHFVALATGRLQKDAVELLRGTGIDSFVADGGNSITVDGELVWMEGMPLDICKRFLHWLDDHGWPWAVMVANEVECYTPNPRYAELDIDRSFHSNYVPDLRIDDLTVVNKIFVLCTREEEETFEFGGVTHARYTEHTLYCEPTNKAAGIRKLMDIFHEPYSNVVTFGDGTNDVSMFEPEWTNVAMGNAVDELKEKADLVTTHVDDDGVYRACKQLGLI